MNCPDANTLAAMLDRRLDHAEVEAIQAHLDACPWCAELATALVADIASTEDPDDGAPETIGRYVIHQVCGRGGMGVVYEAWDPELERRVALKVLRQDLTGSSRAEAEARLLKEARVLASLDHPNVVTIHDVGVHDHQVFLTSAFVEGSTARTYAAMASDWREVMGLYLQAGRGLEAAHRAGLIHRDIKPDNILVRRDGVALLADFGLAKQTASRPSITARTTPLTAPLSTGSHVILGTPAYMPPEQFDGLEATRSSDIFSFCASLFEGLYGFRAHSGSTAAAIAEATRQNKIALPARADVPTAILDELVRGLSARPPERHASITELLDVLETASLGTQSIQRRRWPVVLAVMAIAVVMAIVVASITSRNTTLDQPSHAGKGIAAPDPEAPPAARDANNHPTHSLIVQMVDAVSKRDARTCAALDIKIDHRARSSTNGYQLYRAQCLMLQGRCEEGRGVLRAEQRRLYGEDATDAFIAQVADLYCPWEQTDDPHERLRRLGTQLQATCAPCANLQPKIGSGTCAAMTIRAITEIADSPLRAEIETTRPISGALYPVATRCIAEQRGDCDLARATMLAAQQLGMGEPHDPDGELNAVYRQLFLATAPSCAKPSHKY